MTLLYLRYHWLRLVRHFRTQRLAKSITAALFIAILSVVGRGIYLYVRAGFILMKNDAYLNIALPFYVYELFFLIISYLVFVSGITAGLWMLFRPKNDTWIVSSPAFGSLPWYAASRIFAVSLWPLIILALPALLALGSVYQLGFLPLSLAFLALVFLTVLSVGLVMLALFGIAKILYHVRTSGGRRFLSMGSLVGAVALVIALLTAFLWRMTAPRDVLYLFAPSSPAAASSTLTTITALFGGLPSHAAAQVMLVLQKGLVGDALFPLFGLACFAVAAIALMALFHRWYLPLWQLLQEGRFMASTRAEARTVKPTRFPRFFGGALGALFEKELLTHTRDLKNALWLLFMCVLLVIQTSLNMFLRYNMARYRVAPAEILGIVETLQIVTILYFVSAFVLRFAFPSFSTERKTAWILGSAPVSFGRIFVAKLLFFASIFVALGIAIGSANAAVLGVAPVELGTLLLFLAVTIVFITLFGMVMGARFPNFETDDPQVLSTSLPGLAVTFGSLFYGGLGAFFFYAFLKTGNGIGLVAYEALSVAVIVLLLVLVPRSLRTMEFV